MSKQYRTAFSGGPGLDFVLSDGSRDRHGTRINPNGWVLTEFLKNPIALFAHGHDVLHGTVPIGTWENVRVEGGRLLARLALAAPGTSARLDEIRSLVEQGILKATSVGFNVLQEGRAEKDEYNFMRQELQETSLVAVPSNKNALALARSLNVSNETMSLAFGEQAETRRWDVTTGEQAAPPPIRKSKTMEKSLSQRIEDAQNDLNQARDTLQAHINEDSADAEQTDTLSAEIEVREKRLNSLKTAERALASRVATDDSQKPAAPAIRKPLGIRLQEPKPGDLFVRAAVVRALAFVTQKDPEKVLEERYGDHESTQVFTRAAVAGAKTTVSGWASELIETETAAFMETLRPLSVYPRLAALGTNLSFGPGRGAIKLPSRATTPSISGSFVLEGDPIPVRRLGLTSVTLSPHKMGVISVFSREMARLSNPAIEGLLRSEIQADTALTIDTLLLDATAGSTTRPAGLTNGVSAITASTAGGYAAILEDIAALAAPFDTANAGRRLALLMNPAQARMLAMAPGPDGRFGWAAQFLSEFTVITSTTIPSGDVFMVDAADFATAAGSAPEFEVSEHAVLHMEDTSPAQIGVAGTPNVVAAPVQSMFQTAQIALRMILDITWAMRRTGMVQWIDGADWAPVPS